MRPLALLLAGACAAPALSQDLRSSSGRFLAFLRPPDAPTEVEVVEQPGGRSVWTARVPRPIRADLWRLTDDGRIVAGVDSRGRQGIPLVHVLRQGRRTAGLLADALGVASGDLGAWLAAEGPQAVLRSERRDGKDAWRLDLLGRDERLRSIDLETDDVRVSGPIAGGGTPRVEPAAAGSEDVYVTNWFGPEAVLSGDPLPVHVRMNLPTPAHRAAGFELELGGERGEELLLTPRAIPPLAGTAAPQVLTPAEATASVLDLGPGAYRVSVAGRSGGNPAEARVVRVVPRGTLALMTTSGGFAGIRRTTVLLEDGRVEMSVGVGGPRSVRLATESQREAVARAVAVLPPSPGSRPPSGAADLFARELVWVVQGRPVRAARDDLNLEPELRELVRALEALEVEPEIAKRYEVDLARSFLEVRTGSAGLLSGFGHDHRLMVRRFSGTIEADPDDPSAGSVSIEIDASSLAVVDDDSEGDRAAIEKEMNGNVLEVARHPAIAFRSRKIDATRTVDGAFDLVVHGDLTLHGGTREIRVPGRLERLGEDLRFRGAVSLLQTDFGIRPTEALGGTINVADKVRIGIDVIAAIARD